MLGTIEKMLLKEHSKKQCSKIVKYIGSDKTRFDELMKVFFKGEYRTSQRAAWPMSYCAIIHPPLIQPYLNKLINNLDQKNQHDAIIRNSVRLLQDIDIPRKYHGKLMDKCFAFIESHTTAAAIKAFSLTILHNLSHEYPEIKPELKLVIEDRWDHETAAFRSRARKILKSVSQHPMH